MLDAHTHNSLNQDRSLHDSAPPPPPPGHVPLSSAPLLQSKEGITIVIHCSKPRSFLAMASSRCGCVASPVQDGDTLRK
eukprot:6205260-Amphidinium_carterae.1